MNEGADTQISTSAACKPEGCDFGSSTVARIVYAPTAKSGCVLSDAVAERPVFLFHLDEGDENIFRPDLQRRRQPVGDRLVERLLLRHRAPFVEEDLHHD